MGTRTSTPLDRGADPILELGQVKALIVTGSTDDARELEQRLSAVGVLREHVSHRCRASEALVMLANQPADIVLLDLDIPDCRGTNEIRRFCREVSRIPVIVLSGTHDDGDGLEAVRAGAQDYITPRKVGEHGLARAIQYAIQRKRLLLERSSILETIHDGFYEIDNDRRFTFVNRSLCGIFGRPESEVLGAKLDDFLEGSASGTLSQTLLACVDSAESAGRFLCKLSLRSGIPKHAEVSASLIRAAA